MKKCDRYIHHIINLRQTNNLMNSGYGVDLLVIMAWVTHFSTRARVLNQTKSAQLRSRVLLGRQLQVTSLNTISIYMK